MYFCMHISKVCGLLTHCDFLHTLTHNTGLWRSVSLCLCCFWRDHSGLVSTTLRCPGVSFPASTNQGSELDCMYIQRVCVCLCVLSLISSENVYIFPLSKEAIFPGKSRSPSKNSLLLYFRNQFIMNCMKSRSCSICK